MRETVEQWLRLAGLKESALEASTTLVLLCAVLALAWVVHFVVSKILLRFATALAKRTQSKWDDKLLEHRAFHRGAHIASALVVYAFAPAIFANWPTLSAIIHNVLEAYVVLVTLLAITGALRAFLDVYQAKHPESRVPMRVLVQATNIAMWFIGLIIIIALLIDQSPTVLLGGLGAMTAVLAIVYKDSLLGFRRRHSNRIERSASQGRLDRDARLQRRRRRDPDRANHHQGAELGQDDHVDPVLCNHYR